MVANLERTPAVEAARASQERREREVCAKGDSSIAAASCVKRMTGSEEYQTAYAPRPIPLWNPAGPSSVENPDEQCRVNNVEVAHTSVETKFSEPPRFSAAQ